MFLGAEAFLACTNTIFRLQHLVSAYFEIADHIANVVDQPWWKKSTTSILDVYQPFLLRLFQCSPGAHSTD